MKLGVEIGADVPYCLMRGTALAEGIGEKLTRLPDMPFCHILIAKPPVNVSTKLVYRNWTTQMLSCIQIRWNNRGYQVKGCCTCCFKNGKCFRVS